MSLPPGIQFIPELIYARTADRPLTLDLYLHENAPAPQPLIVYVHGGAWRMGSKSDCGEALELLHDGFAVASVGYRLSQEAIFPAQIHDVKAAVRWLRANAQEHNLNPGRFGAWGPSAGGHLVVLLGLTADFKEWDHHGDHIESADFSVSSAVQAVCDWFGPTDFLRMNDLPGVQDHNAPDSPESQLVGAPIQQHPGLVAWANPINYVHPGTFAQSGPLPPFLICHGDQDQVVIPLESHLLHAALEQAGCASTLVIVPGAGHGFNGDAYREMVEKAREFFKKTLMRDT
jgi:acetyl esterase/lipase